MKFSVATTVIATVAVASSVSTTNAFTVFTPSSMSTTATTSTTTRFMSSGMDTSGNSWKPDSEKMGSTDVGDYFPEGYNPEEEIAFTSGMGGSQAMLDGGDRGSPQLPGLENLGADAVVAGGITVDPNIPAGMEFVPSSVPDGEIAFNVASTTASSSHEIAVKSPCMTFEDYYAAFAPGSHPSLSVTPSAGRMDRRNGEPTIMQVVCQPNGQSGQLTGDLVINLPEDNSKICYKVSVTSM